MRNNNTTLDKVLDLKMAYVFPFWMFANFGLAYYLNTPASLIFGVAVFFGMLFQHYTEKDPEAKFFNLQVRDAYNFFVG